MKKDNLEKLTLFVQDSATLDFKKEIAKHTINV
jgi:hypothetical protein